MATKTLVAAMVATLFLAPPNSAQSAADLLQKGIYTQETVGDLDSAIQIYRQVLALTAQTRSYAAQAHYRLAACLLAKGDRAGAAREIEALSRDYPEQRELIAKARGLMPKAMGLLPVPWGAREVSQYRITNNGKPGGAYMTYRAETDARSVVLQVQAGTQKDGMAVRIDADRDTMLPSMTTVRSLAGEYRIQYIRSTATPATDNQQGQAQVKQGETTTMVPLSSPTFDEEEWPFLLRRLPLAPGYKASIPVMSTQGFQGKVDLEVNGTEDVEVPAGRFRCYKVTLGVPQQIYWIGVEGARLVVKYAVGPIGYELMSVSDTDPGVPFSNPTLGLLIRATGDFSFPRSISMGELDTIELVDAQSQATVMIWMSRMSVAPAEIVQRLRDSIPEKVSQREMQGYRNYQVRPGSVTSKVIGGQQALSCVADYLQDGKPMVEYLTWILSEKAKVLFFATTEPANLSSLQQRLDPVIETTRIQ